MGSPRRIGFSLLIDPSAPQALYAGTASGVWRSDNGGGNWIPANAGIPSLAVATFALDRANATLYAGTVAGVFATTDGGASWTAVNEGLASFTINALVFDVTGTLYAATNGAGVFRFVPASPDRQFVERPALKPPPRAVKPRP
jgi:photosystem II stability/assembly factor-like uncharacterized protein